MDTKDTMNTDPYITILLYSFLLDERAENQKIWEKYERDVIFNNRFFAESIVFEEIEKYAKTMAIDYKQGDIFHRARIYDKDANAKFIEKYKEILEKNGLDFESQKEELENSETLDFTLSLLDITPDVENENDPYIKYKKDAIRRCKNSKFKGFNKIESLPPPKEKCVAGRANPDYIRYLYVCEDDITPIYEIKPAIKQVVSLAKLKLKKDIRVFDFATDYCMDGDKIQGLFSFIAEKFSVPNYNDLIKYIPTQCIAERIKKLGFDGIRFNSSLHAGGKNVVMFDADICDTMSTSLVEISDIKISTKSPGIYSKADEQPKN